MKSRIIFNRNPNVRFDEHTIDVSHLTEQEQQNLLALLRSGQDLKGNRRVWHYKDQKVTPTKDLSGRLI